MEKYGKLAALGALGVSAGAIAVYALIGFIARVTPTGGIDGSHAVLTLISLAVPIAAVVAAHVVYARILMREGTRKP